MSCNIGSMLLKASHSTASCSDACSHAGRHHSEVLCVTCSNLGQTHFWYRWDEAEELMIQTGSSNMYIDTAVVAAKVTVILYVLAEDECLR